MIYFIQAGDGGAIKIGFSEAPECRLVKLQSDNPAPCRLLAVMDGDRGDETALQESLSAFRVRGEWFAPVSAVMGAVAAAIESSAPPVIDDDAGDDAPPLPEVPLFPPIRAMSLKEYMTVHKLTLAQMGAAIGVSAEAVRRYASGERWPMRGVIERIAKVTGGAVTPNDFYAAMTTEAA